MYETLYNKYVAQMNAETKRHSKRVASLMKYVADETGMELKNAYTIGLLHDIGKILIPNRILKKDTRLTPIERQAVDLHAYYSYAFLKDAGVPDEIAIPVLYHHGTEKPKLQNVQCENDEYLRVARILHTVDVFDALTSKRSYKEPSPPSDAIRILLDDPTCDRDTISILQKQYL